MLDILFIAIGLAGLLIGGEMLVRGAVALAQRFRVSPLVIGLTIVGFGTSTPELLTSVQAAFAGSPGIAVGNVVGSNIANLLLIVGTAALLTPIAVSRPALHRDGVVLVVATILCVLVIVMGELGRVGGVVLVLGLVAYLVVAFSSGDAGTVVPETMSISPALSTALLFLGLAVTVGAARILVLGAISAAQSVGLSETAIGLTVVAIGTSMPELITTLVAARKGQADLAIGNIIGSNIFNILGILGVTAILHPLSVPKEIIDLDVWVMAAATSLFLVFAWTGYRIARREGAVLLVVYMAYTGYLLAPAI